MDDRQQLKTAILDYVRGHGVTRDKWAQVLSVVKDAAFDVVILDSSGPMQSDLAWIDCFRDFFKQHPIAEGERFYQVLAQKFSPEHYDVLCGFAERYSNLVERDIQEQEAFSQALEEQRREFFFEDYEYGDVSGEVVIFPDRIEVSSFEYQTGFADTLPKGGAYQGRGSGTWTYPASMRARFDMGKGCCWRDLPVLYADVIKSNKK